MPYKSAAQRGYFHANRARLEAEGVSFDVVGECWECTSHKLGSDGYPMRHGGTMNRFAYRWLVGEFPKELCVLHTCDNRKCINPEHLWLGTRRENNKDCYRKGRFARLAGTKNGRAKLTEEQVREIRASKEGIVKAGERYGVSNQMISRIRRNEAWNAVQVGGSERVGAYEGWNKGSWRTVSD